MPSYDFAKRLNFGFNVLKGACQPAPPARPSRLGDPAVAPRPSSLPPPPPWASSAAQLRPAPRPSRLSRLPLRAHRALHGRLEPPPPPPPCHVGPTRQPSPPKSPSPSPFPNPHTHDPSPPHLARPPLPHPGLAGRRLRPNVRGEPRSSLPLPPSPLLPSAWVASAPAAVLSARGHGGHGASPCVARGESLVRARSRRPRLGAPSSSRSAAPCPGLAGHGAWPPASAVAWPGLGPGAPPFPHPGVVARRVPCAHPRPRPRPQPLPLSLPGAVHRRPWRSPPWLARPRLGVRPPSRQGPRCGVPALPGKLPCPAPARPRRARPTRRSPAAQRAPCRPVRPLPHPRQPARLGVPCPCPARPRRVGPARP
eukprot:XP_020397965.1 vegetative cell wall protein gp1-like [Zea mays]